VSRTGNGTTGLRSHDVSWVILIIAGLLEVAWASMLPYTDGLSRPLPTVTFVALLASSMVLLAKATESIPIGTAYGVWVGIGAVGAAAIGIVLHDDPSSLARLAFVALLVVAIVGLKATSAG
jgi:quaternary ammonium compound-resistance protein SugE